MASKFYNLARMTTLTTGTGTLTLNSAVPGFLTFAQAGVQNGDTVSYSIVEGQNREVGIGVYTTSGTTLTRSVVNSTNGNALLNLSGSSSTEVFITFLAGDFASFGEQYSYVRDQKTSGTGGGTSTTGSWITRTLNTEVTDTFNNLTLSANRITLVAGTYRCSIRIPNYATSYCGGRLQNITDATTVLAGTSSYNLYTSNETNIRGQFTIGSGKQLEVQNRVTGAVVNGLGQPVGGSIGGVLYEIYTEAEFWRIA